MAFDDWGVLEGSTNLCAVWIQLSCFKTHRTMYQHKAECAQYQKLLDEITSDVCDADSFMGVPRMGHDCARLVYPDDKIWGDRQLVTSAEALAFAKGYLEKKYQHELIISPVEMEWGV